MQWLEQVKRIVDSYYKLEEPDFLKLARLFKMRRVPKGWNFVQENQKCLCEIMLLKGVVRGFYTSEDNHDINVSFYYHGTILTPWCTRTIQQKSIITYQALEDCDLVEFDGVELRRLINENKEIEAFARIVMQQELRQKMQRELSLGLPNAEERYLQFRQQFPELENKIPQYHVASYLGITPVSLSRIRKNLCQKPLVRSN